MNTQSEDDDQFDAGCHWHSGKAEARRRTDAPIRWWPMLLIVGACLIALALMVAGRAEAGTAKLTCVPPTQKIDNTPLTDLAGIDWLYGPSGGALLPLATTPGCSYTALNLSAGTWYFAAKAVTSDGTKSALSSVASATIAADKIDCQVSTYGAWEATFWSTCTGGSQTRQETRVRTIVTQPSGGGVACPTLTESRTVTQACAVPSLTSVGGPVYVASPNWTTFSWKLGNQVGSIAPAIACDASRRIDQTDYYRVTSAIVWTGGRKDYVVAKCERKA